jgi:hypothetical protein
MQATLLRLLPLLLFLFGALGLQQAALAQSAAYSAAGQAQFVSPNDFVGSGNATHLGLYSEAGHVEFAPTSTPGVLAVTGWVVYTAANGNELHATVSGTLDQTTGVIVATVTYTGGTGRFVNAGGSSTLLGQMLGGGAVQATVSGRIVL